MFKRLIDSARSAIGLDPEAGPVELFRSMLIEALKSPPHGGIELQELVEKSGVSAGGRSRVVAELYLRFARKVSADGVITVGERAKLNGLAATLGLSDREARSIERAAASEVYDDAARRAMGDGVVTLEEAAHLASLRRNLRPDPGGDDPEVQAGLTALFDRVAFRDTLVRDFSRFDPKTFRLEDYAADAGAPPAVVAEVAEELYAKVVADGVITPAERAQLATLATAFHIAPQWATWVEHKAKGEVYRKAVLEALADGIIAPDEADRLESLRRTLGIDLPGAARVASGLAVDAYEALIRRIAESGRPDGDSLRDLERFKRGLGLSDADAALLIRPRALDIYRETFTEILQDGDVSRQQEDLLDWLRAETGLDADQVAPYAGRIAEAKRLAGYRSGQSPSIPTRKLLEGGEICHWDSACRHARQMARGVVHVEGELVVTSKRILFVSPTCNFSYAPWKILDIESAGNRITIQANGRQGSGEYFLDGAKELEAILVGLAKKGKYTASGGTGSDITRHIPGDVKRGVWARDGGRCVQCQDNQYLEFDHIIPHSLGGANTLGNVQLLCRKCNNGKSDRI